MSKKYVLRTEKADPANFKIDYRKELNDEQYTVVTEGDGPCLVLAGAGSGKTRTLVYRVAYLLEKGVPADRILLMTFTNKAAKEMLNRVESLLSATPKGLWGGTFHSIGNRILRIYGDKIDIKKDFVILDSEDSKELVNVCINERMPKRDKYFPKATVIKNIISLSANLQQDINQVIKERFSYIDDQVVPNITDIAQAYAKKKQLANQLDYDDLLVKWKELLQQVPEVKKRLTTKFQYILVDEYQDTNRLQSEIINNLAGKDSNILVVGDDAQSIYSFRGATVKNILQFPQEYTQHRTFKLETNYRSVPEILDLANESINNNSNQFFKDLHATKNKGNKPVLSSLFDNSQQADFICQRILELQDEEGISLNDVAILFRAHFQSLELELELNKRNIPYEMRGGLRFFEQAHIKDVLAYLKAYTNLQDELSWMRILRMQPGIGDVTAAKLWQHIGKQTDIKAVLESGLVEVMTPKVQQGWAGVQNIMQNLVALDKNAVASHIKQIIISGYQQYLKGNYDNPQDRLEDLNQLEDFATRYESLDSFLADLALNEGFKGQSIVGYEEGPEEAVTLSTIHQAKGLEWKVVFVIGLTDGQFPHGKSFDDAEAMEEERRLFYVAVTRAEDQLYLTYPSINNRGDVFNQPSQFVHELPETVYEKWEIESDQEYTDEDEGSESILDMYLRQHQ